MARNNTKTRVTGKKVLVLTPFYLPIRVIGWTDAIKLKYEDLVDVLVEYDEEVSSPSITWKIPAVIRLRKLAKKDIRSIRYKWSEVKLRDNMTCQFCGVQCTERKGKPNSATKDHVHPRSRGGGSDYTNIVVACADCNRKKGSKTCDEWGHWPKQKPTIPRNIVFPRMLQPQENVPVEWEGYVKEVVR